MGSLLEKLQFVLAILGATIVLICGLLMGTAPETVLFRLLLVMIVYFIVGLVIRGYILRSLKPPDSEKTEPEAETGESAGREQPDAPEDSEPRERQNIRRFLEDDEE